MDANNQPIESSFTSSSSTSEEHHRDPAYGDEVKVLTTTTGPLKSKAYAKRSVSSQSSTRRRENSLHPGKCILTHDTAENGGIIVKAHLIDQATQRVEV